MKRTIRVVIGWTTWAIIDGLLGNPYNPVMALLSAFVVAWCMEGTGE